MRLLRLEEALGFRKGDTFGSVLARHRGIGPGFDVLRLALALIIFATHVKWIVGPGQLAVDPSVDNAAALAFLRASVADWTGVSRLKVALLPMFFALSGFLVMGSAVRTRALSTFMAHRVLRLIPALAVEVVLSAVVLGAVLTRLPLAEYYAHREFLAYFANIAGIVHYTLPGVLEHSPVPRIVNENLWTLPAELYCYLIAALLMLTRLLHDRTRLTVAVALATVALAVAHGVTGMSDARGPYPAHLIVYYFCVGVLFFHWRDHVPARPLLALAVVPAAMLLVAFDATAYLAPVFLAWCTIFVGMLPLRGVPLVSSGDYSYGIYLYGFPITQALVALFPWFTGRVLSLGLAATALTLLFAAGSWHLVEKHVLRLKRRLPEGWFPTGRAAPARDQARAA